MEEEKKELTAYEQLQDSLEKRTNTDMVGHYATLIRLGSQCEHITEFGVRTGNSTACWVLARPTTLVCVDLSLQPLTDGEIFDKAVKEVGINFTLKEADTRELDIEETDLLFIDTEHTPEVLSKELERSGNKARKFIVFHDTVYFPDLWKAINPFLEKNPQWSIKEQHNNCYGLTVLERNNQRESAVNVTTTVSSDTAERSEN